MLPCHSPCKLVFVPIRKIYVQLQFSEAGIVAAKMGSHGVIDFLLDLKFHTYTDNPLAHVEEKKLGTSQVWCLGKLALFDFTIKY